MFNISTKGFYGLAALYELALHYNKGLIQIKDISKAQKIPQNYLEQLLLRLKNQNFVKSYRGKNGGYSLSKSPSQINILHVLTALEGELNILKDVSSSKTLDHFFLEAENKIKLIFNQSLDKLVQLKQTLEKNIMFHI